MNSIILLISLTLLSPTLTLKSFVTPLKLRIVHHNDLMYRLNGYNGSYACTHVNKTCHGGALQLASAIMNLRRDALNTNKSMLYLYAGNCLGESMYNTLTHMKALTYVLNYLNPDLMCLGMNDFDYGVSSLITLMKGIKTPVIATNIDVKKKNNSTEGLKLIKSYILTIQNRKIAFVGYTNSDAPQYSNAKNVIFKDEMRSIRMETSRLRNEGIQFIIAIGNSNYEINKQIAQVAPLVNLVISGSSYFKASNMWNIEKPQIEESDYPIFVKKNGRKIPLLQLDGYGKYLGVIDLSFDQTGTLITYNYTLDKLTSLNTWGPLVADDMISHLNNYTKSIKHIELGHTKPEINANAFKCYHKECLFGNLITDAIVDYMAARTTTNSTRDEKNFWTDAPPIAIINAGIMSYALGTQNGTVTDYEMIESINSPGYLFAFEVSGKILYAMLERTVLHRSLNRNFLHMSGLRVVYDYSKRPFNRVVQLKALCGQCWIPKYSTVKMSKNYTVMLPTFLFEEVKYLTILFKGRLMNLIKLKIKDIVTDQLKKHNFLNPMLNRRIVILNSSFVHGMNVVLIITLVIFLNINVLP